MSNGWDTGHSNSDTESEQQPIDRRDQAIIDAAVNGDVAAVRQWLDDGGDARKCSSHFGGDLVTPEEEALRWVNSHYEPGDEADYRESARLLAAPRLLRPRLRGIFSLRTLVLRGRAAPTAETPAAFARLIVRGTSRPRTRAAAKTLPSPGLPDPLAHHVCKFWLGEPPKKTE